MRSNPVKRKLREGKPTFGTWLSLDSLHTARVLARIGFDWLTLDLEHSAIDWRQAAAVFAAIADAGCVPLARLPDGSHHYIKRTLDGFVMSEFLPPVGWAGQHNTINCAAGHHLREGRWLSDPRYMDDYSLFWFRKGGAVRSYSFWAADSIWSRFLVTGDDRLIKVRTTLPRSSFLCKSGIDPI